MQFDQIPQSQCSSFQLPAARFCPVADPLNLSFFASQPLSLISDQIRLWQLPDMNPTFVAGQVYVVNFGYLQSAPLQLNAIQMPVRIPACFEFPFLNFNGNTRFVLSVATAVFQSMIHSQHTKTLLHCAQPLLDCQVFATAFLPAILQMGTAVQERAIAATFAVADNLTAEKVRFSKTDIWRVKGIYGSTNKPAITQGAKLQLYQIDEDKHRAVDRRSSDCYWCFYHQRNMVLLHARCGGLAKSCSAGILRSRNSALMFLGSISGRSAGERRLVASTTVLFQQKLRVK